MQQSIFFMRWSAVLLLVFLVACNNPLSKTYSLKTYEEDMGQIRESTKIGYDDIELLTKYIIVSRLAGNDLQGKTYEEILDKIKDIRKNNATQNDQLQMEKELKRERMGSLASVGLSEKKIVILDKKEFILYTINFHNKSSKNINIIVGSISLQDLLEREIKKIDILLDEELIKNGKVQKIIRIPYDPADENDQRIKSKSITDLRIEWNPEKIIFTDGSVAQ